MPKPPGLDLVLWFDLSPLRPDEYGRTGARRWTEAVAVRNAFLEGQAGAADEHAAHQEALSMAPVA